MQGTQVTRQNVARLLAAAFVDRVSKTGLRGKAARDKAALEFFVGAAVALNLAGEREQAEALRVALSFNIGLRGYRAVEELATEPVSMTVERAPSYKVEVNGKQFKFETMDKAKQFCEGYFSESGVVLAIIEVPPARRHSPRRDPDHEDTPSLEDRGIHLGSYSS